MTKFIPECPQFPKVVVAGVEHVLTPSPKRLDDFLTPALLAEGLGTWYDAGASNAIMPSIEGWWPETPCPVETVVFDDETGEAYSRWPGYSSSPPPDEATMLAAFPEDAAEDIRAYCRWVRRKVERYEALYSIGQAVEAAGKLRRIHVLEDVVLELECQLPGFVGELVSAHCADDHKCSMAEHDAQAMT